MHTLRDASLCFIAFFYRAMQTYGLQIQRLNYDFGNACPANAGIKKISSILLFFFFAFVFLRAGASLWLKKIVRKITVQTLYIQNLFVPLQTKLSKITKFGL
jgi:hypothetical protein